MFDKDNRDIAQVLKILVKRETDKKFELDVRFKVGEQSEVYLITDDSVKEIKTQGFCLDTIVKEIINQL